MIIRNSQIELKVKASQSIDFDAIYEMMPDDVGIVTVVCNRCDVPFDQAVTPDDDEYLTVEFTLIRVDVPKQEATYRVTRDRSGAEDQSKGREYLATKFPNAKGGAV